MNIKEFIEEFSTAVYNNRGVYFIGAGISVPSGLPNWKDLVTTFVERIGITEVLDTDDLPLLAQYYINNESKKDLYEEINKTFSNKSINNYHKTFKRTNIQTIWTTNYDDLLEQTFDKSNLVKVKDSDAFLFTEDIDKTEIIKIHGSIGYNEEDLVICQSDYEDFFINKPILVQRLKVELLQKSFTFLGYNYGDPNIQNILTEVRRLKSEQNDVKHYIVLKTNKDKKFDLWCKNLERYNIYPILFKDYDELEDILEKISLKSRGKSIFITGSHACNNIPDLDKLTECILENELIIIDGQSAGTMRSVISNLTTHCIDNKIDYQNKIKYFSNPYAANPSFANDSKFLPELKDFRKPLMKASQVVVAFDGGMGTCAEIEVGLEMGAKIIPFFMNKNDKTWEMISKIPNLDKEYAEKMELGKLKMSDLTLLIKKYFEN